MTVFISYGRDPNNPQHLELIDKIKKDLEKSGFKVLIDKENLRAGMDWEIKLESMVDESDWILFFITPYSARRPDGYCLNELALALYYGKNIAPVMVDYIVPPLSICRIQYLDFLNFYSEEVYKKNLQEITSVLKGEKQLGFEGEHTALLNRLDPLEFKSTIAKHIKGFVGREWVYDEIDNWLENEESNILWITAVAGYGKTALSTYISQKHPSCVSIHYCQHDAMTTQEPTQILRTFIYQLSTQIKEYHDKLLTIDIDIDIEYKLSKSPADIFRELIAEPLNSIQAPKNKLFFIIDALDEASNEDKNPLVELIANRFGDLPPWFNILITSRPEPELLRKLKKFNPIELKTDDRKNLEDLKEFMKRYIGPNLSEETMQLLLDKSEGNILYLKMLSNESIDWDNVSKDEINNLPVGMEGFYLQTFERRFESDYYEEYILSYVSVLVSAQESIPVDILRYVLEINKREEKKRRDKFGSLLEEIDGKIGLYHKSLYDWLSDYDLSGEYSADVEEGDKLLSKKLWEIYTSDEQDLPKEYEKYLLKAIFRVKKYKKEKLEVLLEDIIFLKNVSNQIHKIEEAIELWEKVVEFIEPLYTQNSLKWNKSYIVALNNLNTVKHSDVDESISEELIKSEREILEKIEHLYERNPLQWAEDYTRSLNNLAISYQKNNRVEEAIGLYKKAFEILKLLYEKKPAQWAELYTTSLNNLANSYEKTNRVQEAIELKGEALEIRKPFYDKNPLQWAEDYTTSLNNLANSYEKINRVQKAIELEEKALEITKALYDKNPSQWAEYYTTSLNNLAYLYEKDNRVKEAIELEEKAFEITKALYIENPSQWAEYYTISLNNLAGSYYETDQLSKALKYHKQAYQESKKTLGENHHHTQYLKENYLYVKNEYENKNTPLAEVAQKEPIIPKKPKRNDPCLCSSGKRYKECCGKSGPKKGNISKINIEQPKD